MSEKDHLYLLSMGELCLKGKNRNIFIKILKDNFKRLLSGQGAYVWKHEYGRIFVKTHIPPEAMFSKLKYLFGLSGYTEVTYCDLDLAVLRKAVRTYLDTCLQDKHSVNSFRVCARRSNKRFELNSLEVNKQIGAMIWELYPHWKVDLHRPDVEIHIEIRDRGIYLYSHMNKGALGLPVGSSGSGVLLLSGGIDSPVAGWMMLKRGMKVFPVHFHSPPFTSEQSMDKVKRLAKSLVAWGQEKELAVFDLKEIQTYLNQHTRKEWLTIMTRKCMMLLSYRYAEHKNLLSLITGENLGQVASQTAEGMNATGYGMPISIFRPLIGFEKLEIIEIAKRIDTFDTSIMPFEDCCTLFLPKHPETKPRIPLIEKEFERLALSPLLERCFQNFQRVALNAKECEVPDIFKAQMVK